GRGGITLATVKISVLDPNLPPILALDFLTVTEDGSGVVVPLANDTDPNGHSLALVDFAQPESGVLTAGSEGALLFQPAVDFHGDLDVEYTVTDGHGGLATGLIKITVTPVNDSPVGLRDSASLDDYLAITLNVLANDGDIDGDPLRVSDILGSPVGEVSVNADGTVAYRPAAGFIGVDTFEYVLSDGSGGTDTVSVSVTIVEQVLAAAIARGEEIGSPTLGFQAPEPDVIEGPVVNFTVTQGVSLMADAFFQSLGALQLPILFLGLALGTVVVVGGFTELPLLIANRRRRFYSVVMLDREHRLAVHQEPASDAFAIYYYEPTAAGFRSLDRPRTEDGRTWIPVESPNGSGWVERRFLTETVDLEFFLQDDRPVATLRRLAADLGHKDVSGLFGDRGLAVALTNEPEFLDVEMLKQAIKDPAGSSKSVQLWETVLNPLGAALSATADLDSRSSHSGTALIPVELWNLQYLAIKAEGHPPWLVYFEYQNGKPLIVGIGLDV
ncbi:MAG: cadherin-like domain-containing protein, partial [Acidimicrobiia bacterium]